LERGPRWYETHDPALAVQMTAAVRRHISGEICNELALLTHHKGQPVVEFDGAVEGELQEKQPNGQTRTRPVLVLIDSKHKLRD